MVEKSSKFVLFLKYSQQANYDQLFPHNFDEIGFLNEIFPAGIQLTQNTKLWNQMLAIVFEFKFDQLVLLSLSEKQLQ